MMSRTGEALVLSVCLLATSVWVGGYVAIGVVARTAAAVLDPPQRVSFFRSLGRSYLGVGVGALLTAFVAGAVLARNLRWDGWAVSTLSASVALLLLLAVAVAQARRMTRLRMRLLASSEDAGLATRVRREAMAATALRALLGVLSIAIVVLASFLVTGQ